MDENSDLLMEDVDALGKLLADSDGETMERIPGDVLKDKVRGMGRLRCMKEEVRDMVMTRLGQAIT